MARLLLLRCSLFSSSTTPLLHLPRSPLSRSQTLTLTLASSSSSSSSSTYKGGNYLTLTDEELVAQCAMDTYKASGPGGQHRNKRESAVRLKHLPTGVVAQVTPRLRRTGRSIRIGRRRWLVCGHCWLLKSGIR